MPTKKTIDNDKILAALLSSPTVKQAADKIGITTRTIYKRMKEPEFKEEYERERRLMIDRSAASLQYYLDAAIEALGEIVTDKEANQQTRLNAAESIIKNTLRLTERGDILDRLDALERRDQ